MTVRLRGALLTAAVAVTLTACGPVSGTGAPDPTAVVAYAAEIAESRAAEAAAATEAAALAACTQWQDNRAEWSAAVDAATDHTEDPSWTWATIAPLLDTSLAATAQELTRLETTIELAEPAPNIHTLLVDYRARIQEYESALRTDRQNAGTGDNTWPLSNPAVQGVNAAAQALYDAC